MTVSMFARHRVKDFKIWKEFFDASVEFGKQHGVIASNVLRDLDDPNLLIVQSQFADTNTAKGFMMLFDHEEFQEGPVKLGGVIPETLEVWVGKDV